MLNVLFGLMLGAALLYGLLRGRADAVTGAVLQGAGDAVKSALDMAGMFALFCGMGEILTRAGAAQWLGKKLRPALRLLLGPAMPGDALEYAAMNLTANLLGLGNAATPMGVEAARRMARGMDEASNALCMFLVINASSVQLLPTTVLSLRAAEGSSNPGAVILPAIAATGISTLVGVLSCKLMEKRA
ncbi:MAG: spore maturation protein [Clostridia bacterium]|nr:spore maturation protein [Clostridia bacterium]